MYLILSILPCSNIWKSVCVECDWGATLVIPFWVEEGLQSMKPFQFLYPWWEREISRPVNAEIETKYVDRIDSCSNWIILSWNWFTRRYTIKNELRRVEANFIFERYLMSWNLFQSKDTFFIYRSRETTNCWLCCNWQEPHLSGLFNFHGC